MTEYMFLYKGGDPDFKEKAKPEDMQALMAKWGEWIAGLEASGNLTTGGDPLEGFGKKLTADGVVTDMSLAEVKEIVGGYSIVKADNMEQAIEIAKTCPAISKDSSCGSDDSYIEIRPVLKMC
ncbi:MAG: YciI family protein [Nitrospinales bacterium]